MSQKNREFALVVGRRELATILAALRFYQDEKLGSGSDVGHEAIRDIATDCGSLKPLNFNGVDRLCERINTCYERSSRRHRKDWVLIVTDRAEVVHVRAYKSKALAEKGLFKYLREEHDYDGRKSLSAVSEWIEEKAEHLNIDLVQQAIWGAVDEPLTL